VVPMCQKATSVEEMMIKTVAARRGRWDARANPDQWAWMAGAAHVFEAPSMSSATGPGAEETRRHGAAQSREGTMTADR